MFYKRTMAAKTLYHLRSFSTLIIVLIAISTSLLVVPGSCDQTTNLISCLTHHNISNFTTRPYPFHANYSSSNVYFNLLNFSLQNLRFTGASIPKPIVIILPSSRNEVINTVVCCKNESLEIRVRSGGHSYEGMSSFASDVPTFVIIDMMNLDQVFVNVKEESAWVEGGATLGQTYYAISKSSDSLAFPAGSCPTVGVGGQFSGGGFGLLSRKYGVAADNVVDALLIDANGRLLDRKAMGEDVFWAIRGGGGGIFGIIFAWKIKLVQVPKILTAFTLSRPGSKDYVASLLHKWQLVAPKLEYDFYLSIFVRSKSPKHFLISFSGLFLGSRKEALSILESKFPDLEIKEQDCQEMSWIESVLFFSDLENGSTISDLSNRYLRGKVYFKAKSDLVRTQFQLMGVKTMLDNLEKQPQGYVIMDPYGGIMDKIRSDSIAFPHRKGNIFMIQYFVEWEEDENEKSKEYIEWIREFYKSMVPYVSRNPRAAYINYVDLDLGVFEGTDVYDPVEVAREWGRKYFLQNYDRLVRAKTQIDSKNVFRNQQGIPPYAPKG